MKNILIVIAVMFATLLGVSCSAPIPVAPPKDAVKTEDVKPQDTLFEEWQKMSEGDYQDYDYARAATIASKLAEQGPAGLEPFFEVLKNPDATPKAKMLAVVSLTPHINDTHIARLLPLTEPDHDPATRGCALNLLSHSFDPEAFFRVRELMLDEDSHVSKVAVMAMLRKGDMEALEPALAIWDNPETLDRDRNEIILGMPDMLAMNHLRIFREAVRNGGIERAARSRAIQLLGYVDTAEAIPDLMAGLENETDPPTRDMIEAAIAAIQKRAEGASTMPPIMTLGDVDLVLVPHAPIASDTAGESSAEEEESAAETSETSP